MKVGPKSSGKIVIIGAGPAGLGTAYELDRLSPADAKRVVVVDRNDCIGGLARTHTFKGHHFDVGPHRFFTKNKEVLQLWQDMLGEEFLKVPRLTRILYKKKLFNYPVKATDVLTKLGPLTSLGCILSYMYAKVAYRNLEAKTFEQWITKNFGSALFRIFFKTYTEKVWGIPCSEIGAEWAAQRIKNLNFTEVVRSALMGSKGSKAKSLVDTFYYPRNGAGQMYEALAKKIEGAGSEIKLESSIEHVVHKDGKIVEVAYADKKGSHAVPVDHLFSSMPLTHFIKTLSPAPPKEVLEAADKLYYRDHLTVNLVVKKEKLFPDNWIYIHAPEVKMARVANYNNFSDHMTTGSEYTAISVEYFVFQEDELWKMADDRLVELACQEMVTSGLLAKREDVVDGFVIRETESYPTYYMGHKEYFDLLKDYVAQFTNLQPIGRGGMYKYNNMDHSVYSGLLAARNFVAGYNRFDVWAINEDADYLEEIKPAKEAGSR